MTPSKIYIIPLHELSNTHRKRVGKLPIPPITPSDITRIRDSMHLSKYLFAELLGVDYHTLRKWEAGYTKPTPLISLFFHMLEQSGTYQNKIWLQNFRNHQQNPLKRLGTQKLRSLESSQLTSAIKLKKLGTQKKPGRLLKK